MKWGVIFLALITVLAIVLNAVSLKIKWFTFIGILLAVLIFLAVAGTLVYKFIQKKRGIQGEVENAFIFPNKLADKMKKVDLGIQYETSVVSVAFLIVGIITFDIYFIFITEASLPMKIFMAFNGVCGVALMSSMLITYYQQLVAYRESTKFITNFASKQQEPPKKKKSKYPELPELPELKEPTIQPNDEDLPDGYYLAEDGRYYDTDGNEVEFVSRPEHTYKNERRLMR